MAAIFEQLLHFDDTISSQHFRVYGGPSGSSDLGGTQIGLFLEDDSVDTQFNTLVQSGSFTTGSIKTEGMSGVTTNYSIGIDLGSIVDCHMFSLIDNGSYGSGISFSGSNDSVTCYQGPSVDSWTEVKTFQPITRNYISGSAQALTFQVNTNKRYVKFYMDSGPVKSANGTTINMSGIRAYLSHPVVFSSGSYSNIITANVPNGQVSSSVSVTPVIGGTVVSNTGKG